MQAAVTDRLLLSARESSFKCTAIVRMDAIKFLNNDQYSRELDRKNIERIKRIFNTEGCFRLDRSNSIPLLADKDTFQQVRNKAEVGPGSGAYPYLEFGAGELICLHGRHRLLAAYEYLPPLDQFWVVDIFVDPNEQYKQHVLQDFTNSANISDGEIWRYIRLSLKMGDDALERTMWSRLMKGKDQDLHQLIRHPQFCRAFDRLLVFPGLWVGLQLGSLRRFLPLKCDEDLEAPPQRPSPLSAAVAQANPGIQASAPPPPPSTVVAQANPYIQASALPPPPSTSTVVAQANPGIQASQSIPSTPESSATVQQQRARGLGEDLIMEELGSPEAAPARTQELSEDLIMEEPRSPETTLKRKSRFKFQNALDTMSELLIHYMQKKPRKIVYTKSMNIFSRLILECTKEGFVGRDDSGQLTELAKVGGILASGKTRFVTFVRQGNLEVGSS